MAELIRAQTLKVLQQKYGPNISIVSTQFYPSHTFQAVVEKPAGTGFKDLISVFVMETHIARGVDYQVYELTHQVFDPK
jgi:hypothetical protein